MKAWRVYLKENPETSYLVRAETESKAKHACMPLRGQPFFQKKALRAPSHDGDGPIGNLDGILAGFCGTCDNCGETICPNTDPRRLPIARGRIFCSDSCELADSGRSRNPSAAVGRARSLIARIAGRMAGAGVL